jgi:hypothetical protein
MNNQMTSTFKPGRHTEKYYISKLKFFHIVIHFLIGFKIIQKILSSAVRLETVYFHKDGIVQDGTVSSNILHLYSGKSQF